MTQQNSTTFRIGSKIVATGLKPDQVSSLLLQVEPWYSSRKCRKSGMGGRDKVLIQFDFLELVIGIFFPLFFFVQSSMYHSSNVLLFIFDCVLRNFRTEPEIKSFLS
jgi:hypothetical protein